MFPDLAPQARLARGWIAQAASKSAYEADHSARCLAGNPHGPGTSWYMVLFVI